MNATKTVIGIIEKNYNENKEYEFVSEKIIIPGKINYSDEEIKNIKDAIKDKFDIDVEVTTWSRFLLIKRIEV